MSDIQQSLRQASIRAVTGTTHTYEGDWHALFDSLSIAAGDFNGRLLQYINRRLSSSYTEINGAMAAMAAAESVNSFQSIGTFTANLNSITASAGSYLVTGVDATLVRAIPISASAGSYAVSGQAATLTYVGGAAWTGIPGSMQEIGYGSATVTWSSVAINSASTDTVLAFVLSSGRDITGVTIGGDAMTMLIDSPAAGDNEGSIWYKVGAYVTPNIVATGSAAVENVGATFGKWSGASVVPSGEQRLDSAYRDDPKLLPSMTIPASGVGLCLAWTIEQAGHAFNNMTDGDIDTAASGNVRTYLLGSRTTAGAFQASFNTGENNYSGAIGCVLGPT